MLTDMEKEIRSIPQSEAEVRLINEPNVNSRRVEGYGIVFNSPSKDLGGFREVILPSAINGVIEKSDILSTLNHNVDKGVLARSTNGQGTLKLSIDQKGVKYSFEAPNYSTGDELVEGLKRGDIRASSFAFNVGKKGEHVQRLKDGTYLRTITQFNELFDMSPVYREAYSDTTATLRSMEELKLTVEDLIAEAANPVVEETIEKIVEPEVKEFRMNEDDKFLWQKHNKIKLKI
jgi:HK97 family phage prohead protease